ncbi:trafficking protein particle complex subunit 2-like protein isoform X2 [Bombina bombina]|uniref:trafficking protein particle complex subunit 2-like protein isoform X2 n=2 Tax=Bombina bombina TaxID=8345 RepID=UPI00235AC9EF|nr:trafficking protein particle complex subunit 2-like protein isoform X2 [Bombina bombina]
MAVCVAVIAKENYPLYIRSIPAENQLKFHYTVHTSLDVVDEKISAMGKALVDQRELYLGLLYPTEDYKVYGYVTNSKVKFVMVVDSSNTALRDNEIRSMFRKLHNSYTDVMCNPFYNPGDPIQSRPPNQAPQMYTCVYRLLAPVYVVFSYAGKCLQPLLLGLPDYLINSAKLGASKHD